MTRRRAAILGVAILGLACWLSTSLAQDAKEKETKKSEPIAGLPAGILDVIDGASVEKLKLNLAKAKNSLSREGQSLLRTRVHLSSLLAEAENVVAQLRTDAGIEQIGAPEVLSRLDQLSQVQDAKQREEALTTFLSDKKISLTSLSLYWDYQDNLATISDCKSALTTLETKLAKPVPGGVVNPYFGAGMERRQKAALLRQTVDNTSSGEVQPAFINPSDSGEILKRFRKKS